ncbi:MAG: deoxyribonuclease IV [Chloroflexota bacterium]
MVSLKVGGHISLGSNAPRALAEARRDGYDCIQIFASSPGQWRPPVLATASTVRDALDEAEVSPLFIHSIYLINLASPDETLTARSVQSLVATLRVAGAFGASGVVTHIGSHMGRGFEAVAEQVAAGIRAVLSDAEGGVQLILENSAGGGGLLGSTLEELAELIDLAGRPERLRIGLDTAHLLGAGWDLVQPGVAEDLVDQVAELIGLERLALIHANDSLRPAGSHKDRHANIGEGYLGLDGFRRVASQPALTSVPWILETPNLERRVDDITTLRAVAAAV